MQRQIGQSIILALDSANQNCSVAILRTGVLPSAGVLSDIEVPSVAETLNAQNDLSKPIWCYDKLLNLQIESTAQTQAEKLIPLIESSLAQANLTYEDIDLIASSIGPGSFTGLRVAISAAKGIMLATNKPTIGISTLYAQAFNLLRYLRSLHDTNLRHEPCGNNYNRNKNVNIKCNTDVNIEIGSSEITSIINAQREQIYCQKFNITNNELQVIDSPKIIYIEELTNYLQNNTKNHSHNNQLNQLNIICNCKRLITNTLLSQHEKGQEEQKKQKVIDYLPTIYDINLTAQDIANSSAYIINQKHPHSPLAPLYIREPDAKLPANNTN